MAVSYETTVIPAGNHASIAIPDEILTALGANRRAPLVVSVNGHGYRSTATAVDGECRVVFPSSERQAAGVSGGDTITVTLELDSGYREVDLHPKLEDALTAANLREAFDLLNYSTRKEHARAIREAKTEDTRDRRIAKVIEQLSES